MAAISRAQMLKELIPGLNMIFGDEYDTYNDEYAEIFEMDTSERSFEEDQKLSLFGQAAIKPEGTGIQFDTSQESYTTRYTHFTVALGYALTEEAIEDNLYAPASKRLTKALARSMKYTKEVFGARVLNEGFANFMTGDGVSLFNDAHPQVGGPAVANRPSTPVDFSEEALEAATIQISLWTDERGLLLRAKPRKLILPPQLMFEGTKILESDLNTKLESDLTDQNQINAVKRQGIIPDGFTVNHFLTDPDAWFMKTDVPNGAKYFNRVSLSTQMEGDFDTGNVRYKARERYSFGVSDYLGLWGSPGQP